ncbi:polysaccharide deacetylase [Ochrobactrum sp. Sa2BUA5]|jgi:peptidoglycan/xylan/chitin deacetylase (PgdA/CDA1 family)|uniref:Chitooligosaccharide deacetylase n=2 Tax=Brucella/Ochrobactrum group TaxID=2826938 RepID=A0A5N1JGG3_9HYPH|nr:MULTISPECIES: polysaccharide deacetylase [Brucella/Ochrobactrum group]KAA9354285.1 polysaccharide deacetylase [[Ochrobactrum] quorumnocens]MBD7993506.1 polysaccharide deacetylase [Ochrobactrum gallinarum]MDH7792410.1 peptidoglycan/xylan/chitin deacetylase (PgdA/CDA1 family) [Ochrobactrum sp. AN78]
MLRSSLYQSSILWPEARRSAVALAFDVDGPTGDAMLDGSLRDNPRYFTQGAYGPWKALPRLLELLARYELKATFFIPSWVILHWTEQCVRLVAEGHEVAYHGHRHEVFIDCTPQQQLDIMEASKEIFQRYLGVKPVGFRTPSGDWSNETAELLKAFGIVYSSSMRGDDRPYFHETLLPGPGLVEIPARWDIDDYTALAYTEEPDFPIGLDRISDYRTVEANWKAEFEGYHREGLCWTTILHPKVCARPGRLSILEGLFHAIRAHGDDVWCARLSEIAQWWIAANRAPSGRVTS